MAGDKSVASFRNTFGRDLDSDDALEAEKAAAEAATNQQDLTGTQFVFSTEQVARDHEKALKGYESNGRSMSTAGKTTESTRLRLKEAQEQIEELQLELKAREKKPQRQPKPSDETKKPSKKEEKLTIRHIQS